MSAITSNLPGLAKATTLSALIYLNSGAHAFVPPIQQGTFVGKVNRSPLHVRGAPQTMNTLSKSARPCSQLLLMATDSGKLFEQDDEDDEITRLKSMAAKLRAEAAALEAEKAKALADAAEKAFRSFDTNKDGEISAEELKIGLEKTFKMELTDGRVNDLMKAFDESGDGALQLEEFVGVNKFRTKLEALVREEKELAARAAREAKEEAEVAALAEAKLELLNEKPPTNVDKAVSILPYLFPLLDGLQYGRFLLMNEDGSNPFVVIAAILYTLYRSIPFSGFVAFLALNFLSSNPKLNRLVRFNMQQAIFVDIALIIPGLLSGLAALALPAIGVQIPTEFTEVSTDVVFVTLLAVLAYCSVSSLLGITPDKLPGISNSVNNRMPTIDMFDEQGRFIGPAVDEEGKDDQDKKKD